MAKSTQKTYINLYQKMLKIRLVEEKLAKEVLNGAVKTPCHLYVGQEAIAVGICEHLSNKDHVFGTHRSHGHYLAKGGDMKKLFAEIYGKDAGCSKGRGGSMHLIAPEVGFMGAQPIVGGTVPIAVGSALASSIKKDTHITVAFFGDGAMEEGVVLEAMNFASLKKLPIVFICENNLYSSHMHLRERRAKDNIHESAAALGMKSIRIDGQDVNEIYKTIGKLLPTLRKGNGPLFIEAMTYRFRGHVGAIDNTRDQHVTDIRDEKEIARWKKRDPIMIMEKFLISKNILKKQEIADMQEKISKEVDKANTFGKNTPYPKAKNLKKYIFKD